MSEYNPHNATPTLIGFDFQGLVFIYQALQMKQTGDYIAMEIEDDISSCIREKKIYIQAKHSVKNDAKITKDDIAKTLAIWIKKDCDNISSFQLVTNRDLEHHLIQKVQEKNVESLISELQNTSYFKEIQDDLRTKLKNILDKVIIKYEEDIENTIKDVLRNEKYISEANIDRVYTILLGEIKKKYFSEVTKENKDIILSHEDFSRIMRAILDANNRKKLVFNYSNNIDNKNYSNKIFALQIKEIGLEDEEVMDANYIKENFETNLQNFLEKGEINDADIQELHEMAYRRWKLYFNSHYRKKECDEKIAQDLYYEIQKYEGLELAGVELKDKSGGEFLSLSDKPKIGWHYDWEKRYGNK